MNDGCAHELDRRAKALELANLRKNRDLCEPEMHPSIDARVEFLESFLESPKVKVRVPVFDVAEMFRR
jgi:hypothetical protein